MKLRDGALCLVISVLVAAIAYGVGHSLTATYQASGTIRVSVPSENGTSDPDVTAANDLATQYVQLVNSTPVEELASKRLGVPAVDLSGQISGSAVAAQNLLQVTASGSTPSEAVARAQAAVQAVKAYLTSLSSQTGQQYLNSIRTALASELGGRGSGAKGAGSSALAASSIASARAQVLAQGVRDMAGNTPSFQIIDPTGSATETAPKPKLYALIAFIVALLISGRIAFMLRRPVRT
jgi:capsular polysaccharide biosynthesis protein